MKENDLFQLIFYNWLKNTNQHLDFIRNQILSPKNWKPNAETTENWCFPPIKLQFKFPLLYLAVFYR